MKGRVVATVTGQPLGGVALTVGSAGTTSDASGSFHVTSGVTAAQPYSLEGPGILARRGFIAFAERDVTLDAISTTAPFDLERFREIARGSLDYDGAPQPLRRWASAPRLYLRTVDESGNAIDPATLQTAADVLRNTIESFTGGKFGFAEYVQGTETRLGVPGWLTVRWVEDIIGACGASDIARSGGSIELYYRDPHCACGNSAIRPRTIRHELGHAMGLWHSGDPADVMFGIGRTCDQLPSERERHVAAILYSRPAGNMDPDTDPAGAVHLAPVRIH